MSELKYWKSYYQQHPEITKPTLFAEFVENNFSPKGSLIELGCGAGRDCAFFGSNGLEVTGIDQCPNVVEKLNSIKLHKSKFIVDDFTNLTNDKKYANVYSRFTLHSVNRIEASRTLNWAFKCLDNDGKLFIEVRSVNDEYFGIGDDLGDDAWYSDHYRRFVRFDEICSELEEIGFQILYKIESQGLAPYKNEDPFIIRLVCSKPSSKNA